MSLDHRLIDLLVCPLCKGPLHMARDAQGQPEALHCRADRLAFPIRDGIPLMLESEAKPLPAPHDDPVAAAAAAPGSAQPDAPR